MIVARLPNSDRGKGGHGCAEKKTIRTFDTKVCRQ